MSTIRPVVTLICDSRGKGLEGLLEDHSNINILVYRGAKLYQTAKYAEFKFKQQNPDQVYVLAGINNLTTMNKRTRQVSISAPDATKITQQFCDEMNFSYATIRKTIKQDARIIFAPLTGMGIAQYNKVDPEVCKEDQYILDQALLDINKRIISFNDEKGNRTPWTHAIVHRYYRGRYHFAYERLDSDGCHLTDEIKLFWLKKIDTAINANSGIENSEKCKKGYYGC